MGQRVEKYGHRLSTIECYVAVGGLGVIGTDDSAELHRITSENPFTPFVDEIRPVLEPGGSMAVSSEVFAARAQAAA